MPVWLFLKVINQTWYALIWEIVKYTASIFQGLYNNTRSDDVLIGTGQNNITISISYIFRKEKT